jgi:hypothetical protein
MDLYAFAQRTSSQVVKNISGATQAPDPRLPDWMRRENPATERPVVQLAAAVYVPKR